MTNIESENLRKKKIVTGWAVVLAFILILWVLQLCSKSTKSYPTVIYTNTTSSAFIFNVTVKDVYKDRNVGTEYVVDLKSTDGGIWLRDISMSEDQFNEIVGKGNNRFTGVVHTLTSAKQGLNVTEIYGIELQRYGFLGEQAYSDEDIAKITNTFTLLEPDGKFDKVIEQLNGMSNYTTNRVQSIFKYLSVEEYIKVLMENASGVSGKIIYTHCVENKAIAIPLSKANG